MLDHCQPLEARNFFSVAPDFSFGAEGVQSLTIQSFGRQRDQAVGNLLQLLDGKTLSTNTIRVDTTNRLRTVVTRLHASGKYDEGFADRGLLRLPVNMQLQPVGVAANGDYVLAGLQFIGDTVRSEVPPTLAIAHIKPNGDVRNIVTVPLPFSQGRMRFARFALQEDNKLVVAGGYLVDESNGYSGDMWVTRLNSDGATDLSFGNNGLSVVTLPGTDELQPFVAIDHAGRIILATGSTPQDSSGDDTMILLARLTSSGQLDPSFDNDGVLRRHLGSVYGFVVTADNDIVVATDTRPPIGLPSLYRYRASGNDETTFGQGGRVSIASSNSSDINRTVHGVRLGPSGSLLIIHESQQYFGLDPKNYNFTRFADSGSLVSGYGSGGTVSVTSPQYQWDFIDAQIRPDGSVLLSRQIDEQFLSAPGYSTAGDTQLVRVKANGQRDRAFGRGGFIGADPVGIVGNFESIAAIPNDPAGRFYAGGSTEQSEGIDRGYIARFNGDGTLDRTFNANGPYAGMILLPRPPGDYSATTQLLLQPNGKLLVNTYYSLLRFNANGTPDRSFDGDGVVALPLGANKVALARDGKILVGVGGRDYREIKRLFSNGRVDRSFRYANSFTPTGGGDSSAFYLFDLLELPDGRIVFAGQDGNDSTSDRIPTIALLSNSGTRLASWRGYADQTYGNSGSAARQLALSPDGQSLIALVQPFTDGYQIERYDLRTGTRLSTDALNIPDGYLSDPRLISSPDRASVITTVDGRLLKIDLGADGRVVGDLADWVTPINGIELYSFFPGAAGFTDDGGLLVSDKMTFRKLVDRVATSNRLTRNGTLEIAGGNGHDAVELSRSGSDLLVRLNGTTRRYTYQSVRRIAIDLLGGDDVLSIAPGARINRPMAVLGGRGLDQITTGQAADFVDAGAGNDTIVNLAGDDTIFGNGGADRISGSAGNEVILPGAGDDIVFAADGFDRVFDLQSFETILFGDDEIDLGDQAYT